MSNIVKLRCIHYLTDWTETVEKEIDLDQYVFFEVDYRGRHSWHIQGHWCTAEGEWHSKELSDHGVYSYVELASFIAKVNAVKPQRCRVSRFNNLHYYDTFYEELSGLLRKVSEIESKA